MKIFKKTIVFTVGLAAFIFLAPANFIQNLWSRLILGNGRVISLSEVYAETLTTVEETLKTLFPNATEIKEDVRILTDEQKKTIEAEANIKFDPQLDKEVRVYSGYSADKKLIGCAMLDTVKGKWGPIEYMMGVDIDGKVVDVIVISYTERRGRPVAERRFLDQFKGKTAVDTIALKKDIRGVSGATISSRGMTDGIRKLVHIFKLCCKP